MTKTMLFDVAVFLLTAASAVLWFISARVRLRKIGPGLEELDHVAALSNDLQEMARWNFWAALTTCLAAALQAAKLALV